MSIEITNTYSNYATNNTKKTDNKKSGGSKKEGNVTTSTVEIKTSAPGIMRTEQIKTGFSSVNDYSKYLQDKYSYMNTGITSMQGVPATVSVPGAFLKKCMNDIEKAAYLEENLAAIPECAKMAVNGSLGTLTSLSYQIDDNGNITCISSGTNDPDGKIARENAKRKAQEKRAAEEKAANRREKKKAEEEKTAKRRAERKEQAEKLAEGRETGTFMVSATGTNVKSVMQNLINTFSGTSIVGSFDIKA